MYVASYRRAELHAVAGWQCVVNAGTRIEPMVVRHYTATGRESPWIGTEQIGWISYCPLNPCQLIAVENRWQTSCQDAAVELEIVTGFVSSR